MIEKETRSRWDFAIGFLDMLQEKSIDISNYVSSIFELSINHRQPDPWEYYGINRLYARIWQFLNDTQRECLAKSLHIHYAQCRQAEETGLPNFFYLCNDLHQMILWQAPLLDNDDRVAAFESILDMHTNWITSFNKRSFIPMYSDAVEANESVTWHDICQTLKKCLAERIE